MHCNCSDLLLHRLGVVKFPLCSGCFKPLGKNKQKQDSFSTQGKDLVAGDFSHERGFVKAMAHSPCSPLVPLAELIQGECCRPPIKPQEVHHNVVVVRRIGEGTNDLFHNADPGHVLRGLNTRFYLILLATTFYYPGMQSFLNPYLNVFIPTTPDMAELC